MSGFRNLHLFATANRNIKHHHLNLLITPCLRHTQQYRSGATLSHKNNPQPSIPMKKSIGHPLLLPVLTLVLGTCLFFIAFESGKAATIVVPYSDNFDGDSTGAGAPNFTTTSGTWTVESVGGGNNVYLASVGGGSTAFSLVQASNLGAVGNNFTFSTTVNVTDDSNSAFFGMVFLSNSASPGSNSFYYADLSDGLLRINKLNTTTTFGTNGSVTQATTLSLNTTDTLTMSIAGVYDGAGALNLTFTVSNGTTTSILTATDTNPYTMSDPYFGYRLRTPTAGDSLSVNIDNFSIVPEPTSLLLAAMGLMTLVWRARRAEA